MITLADRKLRFLLGKRISGKTATEVEEDMVTLLFMLPPELRRSYAFFFNDFIAKMNLRLRECLGCRAPAEVFYDTVLHLT